MMSELRPPMQSGGGMEPPALSFDWEIPERALDDVQRPFKMSIWAMPGLWLDIGVRLSALVLAAWIGARWLSEPIRRLARAAKALGQDIDHPPLAEDGPLECREASQVFNQILQSLLQSMADDQLACGHSVRITGTTAPVRAQASAMRRCIGNLVENAIRYGGAAHIQLQEAADSVCIEIMDPGPGLPGCEMEQVLAPFYRVEASRNRHHGGVGLGLSISHDIARKHQGSLQLRNGCSSGLVVTLRLPR